MEKDPLLRRYKDPSVIRAEENHSLHCANTNDFAWFADKRFNVMKGSTVLPETGREVTTWIMFTNLQARLWIDAPEYVNGSLLYFSGLLGDYPLDNYTVVQSILGAGPGIHIPALAS
jgi:hypothetical protein